MPCCHVNITAQSTENVCPGDVVTLTCELRADILQWSGTPYISELQPLQFSTGSQLQDPKRDRNSTVTVATLISDSNGFLRSELDITTSSDYRSFNVTCGDISGTHHRTVNINLACKTLSTMIVLQLSVLHDMYS